MTLDLSLHLSGFSFLICEVRIMTVPTSEGQDQGPMKTSGLIFTIGHKEGPGTCQVLQKLVKHKGFTDASPALPWSSALRALLTGKAISRPRHRDRMNVKANSPASPACPLSEASDHKALRAGREMEGTILSPKGDRGDRVAWKAPALDPTLASPAPRACPLQPEEGKAQRPRSSHYTLSSYG